jgi:hypothetical protein
MSTPRHATPPDETPTRDESTGYARLTTLDFLDRCSPRIADFYRYYESKRHGRAMPSRHDFDPLEMKDWLPGIVIVDVQENPRRLIYRLVGSHSVELRQRDVTGQTVEEGFHGSSLEDVLENYRLVVDEHKIVYDWDATPSHSQLRADTETLFLPLSSDGRTVDKVLIYLETRIPREET